MQVLKVAFGTFAKQFLIMAEIQPTNICCFDLDKDCIDYFKSLGLNVYEGSLGSVLSINWDNLTTSVVKVLVNYDYPNNLHEYHVFVTDTDNASEKNYIPSEHRVKDIESKEERCLTCHHPISKLDLRPYGTNVLKHFFDKNSKLKRIEVVFVGPKNEVEYTSDGLVSHSPDTHGPFSNYSAWHILTGEDKYGMKVSLGEYKISNTLFESRQSQIRYYHTFHIPFRQYDDELKKDKAYISLLENENGECISYVFCLSDDYIQFVLPQVEDKAALLKDLFEKILFKFFSKFFPDIEANRWISQPEYILPEEKKIEEEIAAKREEYEKEIAILEKKYGEVSQKYAFLKDLLTSTGDQLVKAVKAFLEWLGFENVIEKDEIVEDGHPKEEDIDFNYKNQLVLLEVKGINGTSTDSECSQIDKVVYRRIKQLGKTNVHGVYIVNNQKNVEPLKRQKPPFNETQISDAVNQERTMIYTAQLFALYSDIEKGFITKENARKCFLIPGLADFHSSLCSLGEPYKYYQGNTVICLELAGKKVSVGDTIFYKDKLQRLVGLKVESIQQENSPLQDAAMGETAIKVNQKVPKGVGILIA